TGLVLQNNNADDLDITANGDFTFAAATADGSGYNVTVLTQPTGPSQTCTVNSGSGTVGGANVTDVTVVCSTNAYTIGGTVSGLTGTGLVLQNNSTDDLDITVDGDFTFATAIADGSGYTVTVLTQPTGPSQTCTVNSGSGTVGGGNITDVTVICSINSYTIGGTVSGLIGTGPVLQNNDADDLSITVDGSFTFTMPVADTAGYSVTVLTQPAGQTCTVSNATGTVSGANVTNIAITCTLAVTVTANQPKVLTFSWSDVGADHYKLLKNPDGIAGYSQIGGNIFGTNVDEEIPVHLQDWVNASYIVQSCDAFDICVDSAPVTATSAMLGAIGYFKASNTESYDRFGYSVSLSGDGNTMAVGAWEEDSSATGINGNQTNNNTLQSGAVYVFVRSGGTWSQQAYVKASNNESLDWFGSSVALSGDGNTLAVGAAGEDSAATGINGNMADNSASQAGAVYIFVRSGGTWT
ncbi:hypothetical protein LCGC14_2595910, partial [marine sediment metagenome]